MSGLRITGGKLKGLHLEVPRGPWEIRPAMDMMRESLFSILGNLDGRSFLDLFSGSGIMAVEAASRGAGPIVCVERDRAKLRTLIRNVSMAEQRIECRCVPVERFIVRCHETFSVIFCDPPFPYEFKTAMIESIAEKQLLAPDGLLLIHYPAGNTLPLQAGDLVMEDEREYGRSRVRFYRRKTAVES
jgi:16S rRNA (guanine966-N2)-methyltransferase